MRSTASPVGARPGLGVFWRSATTSVLVRSVSPIRGRAAQHQPAVEEVGDHALGGSVDWPIATSETSPGARAAARRRSPPRTAAGRAAAQAVADDRLMKRGVAVGQRQRRHRRETWPTDSSSNQGPPTSIVSAAEAVSVTTVFLACFRPAARTAPRASAADRRTARCAPRTAARPCSTAPRASRSGRTGQARRSDRRPCRPRRPGRARAGDRRVRPRAGRRNRSAPPTAANRSPSSAHRIPRNCRWRQNTTTPTLTPLPALDARDDPQDHVARTEEPKADQRRPARARSASSLSPSQANRRVR